MAKPFDLKAPNRQDESEGQRRVVERLRYYLPDDVWWTVSLSGIRLPPQVAANAKRAGMQRGAPDFSFVWPDGATTYIEAKSPIGELTDEQRGLALRLGGKFAVVRFEPGNPAETWRRFQKPLLGWMAPLGLEFLGEREAMAREVRRLEVARTVKRRRAAE